MEGGQHNDWSEWEKLNADRLARSAERAYAHWLPSWDAVKSRATDPANYVSGRACDHYHRYEQDFDLMRSLGMNVYRFSVEWSRIEPAEGRFDQAQLEHYRQMVAAMRRRGIEPMVTLWHWTIPLWLRDRGGWRSKAAPGYFKRYTERVVKELGDQVRFWITVNEPGAYTASSYLSGAWPPQRKSPLDYLTVVHHLIRGHKLAYQAIKTLDVTAQVGVAESIAYFEAYRNNPYGLLLKKLAELGGNRYFLDHINHQQDFVGLNHYFHNRIRGGRFNQNDNQAVSDLGWELYPEAIYRVLIDLKGYGKPVYITENGLADGRDRHRRWFITETLGYVHRAIQEGTDVRGYLHWSLLDNFEWDKGFWPRFGLVEVDYNTLERRVRPSTLEYSKIIKQNGL